MRNTHRPYSTFFCVAFSLFFGFLTGHADAQTSASPQIAPISVVMLSDLHLDPFHDPAKVAQLVSAPVDQWNSILSSPDSPTQAADFSSVQHACKSKQLMDSPFALFNSALQASRTQAPNAHFVIVSGDLLVHDLDCRYRAAMKLPKATGDDQSLSAAFAEKTTLFVISQVESVFSGMPVYFALGNNDSRCNHNRLDVQDAYLQATSQAVINGLRGATAAERKKALATYKSAGYYSVTLAAPMRHTRLLVIDDIYMMSKFEDCEANEKDQAGAQQQITWLNQQLDQARQQGEQVWLLGHVPPTVNPISSLLKGHAICTTGAEGYIATDDLTNALVSHAEVVHLAIFGHTHMDEIHILGDGNSQVPVKVIPSVSPISGNRPSFTIGMVDPSSATLLDYTAYEASNQTGLNTTWAKEYDFTDTYHENNFTAKSLDDLIGRFRADTTGSGAESQAYQAHFFKGASFSLPAILWQGYVCSLDHATNSGFAACVCKNN
jgi:sphingomyelin phosphodiesterase acid-like 3